MIYIICFLVTTIFIISYILLRKPKLKYDYIDMIEYNKSIRGTNEIPLPLPSNSNELDILLNAVSNNKNDDIILNTLTEVYTQLIVHQDALDVSILAASELLYNRANKIQNKGKSKDMYRASRIAKRLAHNLYRKYRNTKPGYSNSKFLQFID